MSELHEAAAAFLACHRIAVAGVSRTPTQPANHIYRKLRDSGHEVFPVNPRAETAEGVACFPSLEAIPGGVEALMIATPPEAAEKLVEECGRLGVKKVWMHRSFGPGSVSPRAVERGEELGISVIGGACPMMYCEPVDIAHRCMRWVLGWTGGLPDPS